MITDRPLRILQAASHAKVARGGAVQMIRLAAELARRGHHVECAVHHPRGNLRPLHEAFSELFEAGLAVTGFDQDRWGEVPRFRRWLQGKSFDILHAHRDRALGFAWLATLGMAQPALVANRGTTYPIKRWTLARRAFRSRRLGAAIAVARAVKQALVEDGVATSKVHVVYGSVDERFHPGVSGASIREAAGLDERTPLVGLPAALVHKKGHRDFVRMIPLVLSECPEAHFLWAGEGKREKFESLTHGLSQPERLHWLGHRDDMPEVLAACDVVCCCSTKGEGLTGVLREALAMARPVVTTDVSGNTEMVRDGETGRVVPAGVPEAMARAVVDLLASRDQAMRLAWAGHEWVARHCSDAVRAECVLEVYRRVLAERGD